MTMTSTYDHRVIQGAQSGEYLRRIDELLHGADNFYESVFASLGSPAARRVAAHVAATRPARRPRRGAPSDEMLRAVAAGMALVSAYRRHGHLGANSIRSAPSRSAIRRSNRRPTA